MSFSDRSRTSFFSYLPPQTCVDLSNQMYIGRRGKTIGDSSSEYKQ
ncbi:hypothetical protein HMPREF0083_04974 [Aneurinibacillus aneurinilyticus ATCC 12856]|uniref:Uncharacterized protein n=1 Tax=Aneurinibacillus aneurinilyticus ATCC 12856 TaxID=649747 RepID=U1WW98_ANEAE|nr:hypothetical protein HMPREF0083_04974 [Aneurinibacillus aneurinilyticus ATCC 12856]